MEASATRKRQGRCLSQRGYRGRVRSGCLTCRARRVKCDEQRPVCHNCSRLRRSCVYKPRALQPPPLVEMAASQPDLRTTASANRKSSSSAAAAAAAAAAAVSTAADSSEASSASRSEHPPPALAPVFDLLPGSGDCILTETFQLHGVTTTATATTTSLENAIDLGSFGSPDILTLDVTSFSDTRPHDAVIDPVAAEAAEPRLLSTLISRDIQLTTTIDILGVCDASLKPTFSFFLEELECPLITPYDEVNWRYMKEDIVELGDSHPAIASAISAVAALYRGQLYSLPLSNQAVSLYHAAKHTYEKLLDDLTQDFSIILAATLLLCLFEVVHYETTPILKEPRDVFIQRLAAWKRDQPQLSPLSSRIITWLRLLYATTVRGGGMGLISDSVFELLPDCKGNLNLPLAPKGRSDSRSSSWTEAATQIYNILSAPIFEFYYQLQGISGQIARLTHYHRSRFTGVDQEEVAQQIARIRSQLHDLWDRRSPTQRQSPEELHGCLAPHIANSLIKLIGVCTAAYHAEFIEMGRVLGDPISESPHSKHARSQIRCIIDGPWNAYEDGKLSPGYLRPLFLYAIECMDQDECRWAVERLEQIKNPICRSEFFASFGKALSAAQLQRGRRVTSKYFCIWHFGVSPPFL